MQNRPFIALEMHDATLWEPSRVLPIIDKMEAWGYNTLVLHQNDLLDCCTQLGLAANYGVSDLRLKKVRNNVSWLTHLATRLAQFDAQLFIEIKEPSYHDYALEFYPNLLGKDGLVDPGAPAWAEFCRAKVQDILRRVPDLGGLIVNLSSPESRVSLPDYLATTGDPINLDVWFDRMVSAFQEPLSAAGKELFVRDFSYTADMQSQVIKAVERRGGHVGASVKITAHDYFPEFPENPVARQINAPLILEFEAFGEHTGWGVIPNCRVEEFGQRMALHRDVGARGFLLRTSWEAITGANALDGLSAVNVFALPQFIDAEKEAVDVVKHWLSSTYDIGPDISAKIANLMLRSWEIPAAAYWDGKVFPRHSCLPSTWQQGWISMQTNGMGRRDLDAQISQADPIFSDDAQATLLERKERATRLADELAQEAAALQSKVENPLKAHLDAFSWLVPFSKQFELATKATFLTARASSDDVQKIGEYCDALEALADDLSMQLSNADVPHHARVLLDPDQIRTFTSSVRETNAQN